MVSESVRKLIQCEKKAKDMVNRARLERNDLLQLAITDAQIQIDQVLLNHSKLIEDEKNKEKGEVEELINFLREKKNQDMESFESEFGDNYELVDEIVESVAEI